MKRVLLAAMLLLVPVFVLGEEPAPACQEQMSVLPTTPAALAKYLSAQGVADFVVEEVPMSSVDSTPVCPLMPCSAGSCLGGGGSCLRQSPQTWSDLGYTECQISSGVMFICTGGTTVHHTSVSCFCGIGGPCSMRTGHYIECR